ncbi:MAG TPA: cupin domain-containing protein [Rhizomicrobium sp.]
MKTQLQHLSDVPVATGLPKAVRNPIKPQWFAGKHEAQLGRVVGMTQFGVNRVTLDPGAYSALRHWHEGEDEFVFVLSGTLVLIDENGEHVLREGSIAGFPAGEANGHHLANRSEAPASFLVVGTRKVGRETVHYPYDGFTRTVERDAAGNRIG